VWKTFPQSQLILSHFLILKCQQLFPILLTTSTINGCMSTFHVKTPVRDSATRRQISQGLYLININHSPSQTFQTVGFHLAEVFIISG
jgi:hypothetical protein